MKSILNFALVICLSAGLFTTGCTLKEEGNRPPRKPSNPYPADGATGVTPHIILRWSCSDPDGDSLSYLVFFGGNPDFGLVFNALEGDSIDIWMRGYYLAYDRTFYWKVVAKDEQGEVTSGDKWRFTTGP